MAPMCKKMPYLVHNLTMSKHFASFNDPNFFNPNCFKKCLTHELIKKNLKEIIMTNETSSDELSIAMQTAIVVPEFVNLVHIQPFFRRQFQKANLFYNLKIIHSVFIKQPRFLTLSQEKI